jgi:hypothetical protein
VLKIGVFPVMRAMLIENSSAVQPIREPIQLSREFVLLELLLLYLAK